MNATLSRGNRPPTISNSHLSALGLQASDLHHGLPDHLMARLAAAAALPPDLQELATTGSRKAERIVPVRKRAARRLALA